MSSVKLTKKQKKGLAFRERKGKRQDEVGDMPEEDSAIPVPDVPADDDVSPKSSGPEIPKEGSKVGKKRKRELTEGEDIVATTPGEVAAAEDASKRKGKKRKMSQGTEESTGRAAPSKMRFILFVGNLKYTTSVDDIKEHFSACDPPPQVRLLTPKAKSSVSSAAKSKGCAFLEFSHRNALQQGLKLHGSTLDGRRINVELTAGGGGKSEKRVEKVKARNKNLIEERKSRVQKKAEAGGGLDNTLTAPPQRHSTTSGMEEAPQKRRTWTVPEKGEESGRGGVKKRGKKSKTRPRDWGTGANSIAVG